MNQKIDKIVTCPYCNNKNEVIITTKKEAKDLITCDKCGRLFVVYFNRGEYEAPICANECSDGFIYISAMRVVSGWKAEARKVLKSGKLSKKVCGYREYKFGEADYIECLGCGDKWEGMFNEDGRVL